MREIVMRIRKAIMIVNKDIEEMKKGNGSINSRRGQGGRKQVEDSVGVSKRGCAGENRENKRQNGKI